MTVQYITIPYRTVLCYHPYLLGFFFAVHIPTSCYIFNLVYVTFVVSSRCIVRLNFASCHRAGKSLFSQVSSVVWAEESLTQPPCFATLALIKRVGGAYMWDLTFYFANTPPLQKLVWHQSIFASLILKIPFGQDWLTEVGHSATVTFSKHLCRFVLSMCFSTDTTCEHACNRRKII